MDRGEVWWAQIDEKRAVVLLSHEKPTELMAMVVVAPASTDISGIAVEVKMGTREGLPGDGVVRVGLPRPGKINCSWLVTLRPADLIEQVGELSPAQLREFDEVLRLVDLG
jgi:mRNA interferase MazF